VLIREYIIGNVDPIPFEHADSAKRERFQRVQQAFTLSQFEGRKILHISKLRLSKECLQRKKGCNLVSP